jgi:DNA-binding beta-propeller fold protein YncE
MKTRTSLVVTGMWLFLTACTEPTDYADDEQEEVESLDAQGRQVSPSIQLQTGKRRLAPRCSLTLDAFPAAIEKGLFGDIAFDAKCGILIADAPYNRLLRFNSKTSEVSVVAEDFPEASSVLAVAYVPSAEATFVATAVGDWRGQLFRIDAQGTIKRLLKLEGEHVIRALAVAPASWEPYGGQLVMVQDGAVFAVHPDDYTVTKIAHVSEMLTDLSFSQAGELFVADYAGGTVQLVHPDGELEPIAEGLRGVDGIAADATGAFIYASEADAQIVSRLDRSTGGRASVTFVGLEAGPGVTGLLTDRSGAVIVSTIKDEARELSVILPPH